MRTERIWRVALTVGIAMAFCSAMPAAAEEVEGSPTPSGIFLEAESSPLGEEKRALLLTADLSAAQAEANLGLQHRATRVDIVEQLKGRLADAYAGVWFDNEAGEFVVPLATLLLGKSETAREKAKVEHTFAAAALGEETFRTEAVATSRSKLESAQEALGDDLRADPETGTLSTALDVRVNAVIVRVPENIDMKALSVIERHIGDLDVDVLIRERPIETFQRKPRGCIEVYRMCDLPLRGGQQMFGMNSPDPWSEVLNTCTVGFRANGYDGRKYILTAGHCTKRNEGHPNAGTIWNWMASDTVPSRHSVGTTSQWRYPGKDWAKIDVTGQWPDAAPWPTQLAYWGGPHEYPIVGEAKPYVGQTLCHSGANTGTSCGEIVEENIEEEWYGGFLMKGAYEMWGKNLCVGDGDSGGPMFANNIALGLLSGGGPGNGCGSMWISFYDILEATADLDVNIAHWGAPEVITGAPSNPPIPPNNERGLSGQVNPHGLPTDYQVEYGIGAFTHSTAPVSAGSGQGFVSVYPTLYGLLPGTTYQYRLKAANSLNTAYGSTGTFKPGTWPGVNGNLPTTEIATKQATIRASVNPNNAPTTWWFEWGPTESMGKETPLNVATGLGPVEVKHTLTGLTASTKYWYRVIVSNSGGLKTGPTGTFNTAAPGWLSRFGEKGSEPGLFKGISGVAVDAAGNAYVADLNNNRMQKFDPDGNFVMQFGVKGSAPGQLFEPRAITVDQEGDIWIAESGNKRIQEFTPAGGFIRQIGPNEGANKPSSYNLQIAVGGNGRVYLAQEDGVLEYSATPNAEGKYFLKKNSGAWWPKGLAKHPVNGRPYFLSREKSAIFRVEYGGLVTKVCDLPSTTTPPIKAPEGLAIDSDGGFLIASSSEHAIMKLSATCGFQAAFGSKGIGPGQVTYPSTLALAPSGILFVGESTLATNPGITRWAG